MDNIPEREQPKAERIIQLGEEFQPFDPEFTNKYLQSYPGTRHREVGFSSQIKLSIGNVGIPIIYDANPSWQEQREIGQSIAPFEPTLGYQIDSEDLKIESRISKMKRLDKVLRQNIDFAKAPLYLDVSADRYLLHKLGLNIKHGFADYQFSQEMLDLLRRLRNLVSFPESRFEAKPLEPELHLGEIHFIDFYPIDSGPLPTTENNSNVSEGFSLYLPSDPEKLAQIRARFVLADDLEEQSQPQT